LLDAAERLAQTEGIDALSVRRLADQVGTTTRAVYSLFGSKDGLLVALGVSAFDWLASELDLLPVTDDPVADLVEAGAGPFRRLVQNHPALFAVGIQQTGLDPNLSCRVLPAAQRAMERLKTRLERLEQAGELHDRTIDAAALEFHALCEGLAVLELRGAFGGGVDEAIWRQALATLVQGMKVAAKEPR
jgi:AcrR family transcriptional regulator